jgi:NAD(P)-dependent dehydrogenase (short-subunit alcohol dehydrogenase family)
MKEQKGSLVISGASTGIGEACALYLARQGWQVFAGVRKPEDAERLHADSSGQITPIFLDVTNPEQIAAAARQVTEAVGEAGIAGLVNNAGIAVVGPLEFLPLDDIRQQMEINFLGQVAVTQAFLPLLRKARGRIINMSSISGRVGAPFFGPYAASKFALEAFTDSLRRELMPWNMEVISIEPGSITTPMWAKSLQAAQERLAGLSEVGKKLYEEDLESTVKRAKFSEVRGLPPQVVVDAVEHALSAKRPKTRYIMGKNTRTVILLTRILPDRWVDWIVRRSFYE